MSTGRPSPSSTRAAARERITPEHLNVAPALLGAPLARPRQRLFAIALDVALVALVSDLGNLWLVAGAALAALTWLRRRHADAAARRVAAGALAALLMGVGVWQFAVTPHALPQRGHLQAEDRDDDEETAGPATGAAAGADQVQAQQLRIARLEARLAEAREPKGFDLRQRAQDWLEDVGLGLGWAIAYFTLLPVWWNGQTIGKKLFGIRVVELTGKPFSALRAFGRYGGYAAGMATGGFGFAQVWWDPNRQCIQDKTAHTVVIDLRRTLRPLPAEGSVTAGPPPPAVPSTDETSR